MTDFYIRPRGDSVDELRQRIARHGDAKALQREFSAGLNRSTKDVRAKMTEAIPAALPTRGGLSGEVQRDIKWSTRAKGGRYAGVTLWARSRGRDIRTLVGSRLRHPVWGMRHVWVAQTQGVNPDAFTGKFDDQKPDIQRDVVRVMEGIARKVEG